MLTPDLRLLRITAGNIDTNRPFANTAASHALTTTSEDTMVPRSTAPRCCPEYPTSRLSCTNVSPRSIRNRRSSTPSVAAATFAESVIFGGRPGRRFPPPMTHRRAAHPPRPLFLTPGTAHFADRLRSSPPSAPSLLATNPHRSSSHKTTITRPARLTSNRERKCPRYDRPDEARAPPASPVAA